jgi:hypothetical protein
MKTQNSTKMHKTRHSGVLWLKCESLNKAILDHLILLGVFSIEVMFIFVECCQARIPTPLFLSTCTEPYTKYTKTSGAG